MLAALVLAGLALSGCARLFPRPAPPPPPPAPAPAAPEGALPPSDTGPPPPSGPLPPDKPGVARGVVTEAEKPEWMRGLVMPDLPLRWYPKVTRFLELYRNDPRYREIMKGWLRRLPVYRATIEAALAREGLPTGLVFVAMIESGFTSSALSSKGAGGFWQFLAGIGRGYGLEVSFWVDERRDLEKSSAAAALYLGDLYARFGSWELALAGYNAGFHAVLTSVQRFNTNDFYSLSMLESGLPWETTEYVPKIFAAAIVERNRAVFGFADVVPDPPRDLEPVTAPPGASFEAIARRLGMTEDEVALFNATYLRRRTPPDRPAVVLQVPRGKAKSLDGLKPGDLSPVKVRPGETLARLAKVHKVPRERLRRINGVSDESEVLPGTTLLIPRATRPAPKPKAGT